MSLAALALVLGHAAVFGIVHEADEGAAAHVWQILMVGGLKSCVSINSTTTSVRESRINPTRYAKPAGAALSLSKWLP